MTKHLLLYIVLFFCSIQYFHAQEEDGVVSFDLPVRNSLKFNKYIINPTFSFVREQNRYVSAYNKRQWVQFDNAPLTYMFSYAGRFRENIGIGVGLYQQDYGVLTSFGGVLNFAYNAVLDRYNNLTFGMNVGVYNSGINDGKVVTNFPDPSLDNIPSNTLVSINPGINFGTEFFDFGVSVNNLVLYNIKTSEIVKSDPEQSIQAHVMYTGYIDSWGFFDKAKFSGLVRSEFKRDKTVLSGIAMLTVPKGIWAQTGYNSLYGFSAGIGLNISSEIAIEYNFEKALGDVSAYGSSHEITLAYKIKNRDRYIYSDDDEEKALIFQAPKYRPAVTRRRTPTNTTTKSKQTAEERARLAAEAKAKAEAEKQARLAAQEQARLEAEARAKQAAEERARLAAEAKAREEAEKQARLAAQEQAKLEAEAKAKREADERARLAKEEQARLAAEAEARANASQQDETVKSMDDLTKITEDSKAKQQELLDRLVQTVASREQDLKDLKEENDLSERGIYVAPKPFKSITAENNALEALRSEIDNVIKTQNEKISELERLYSERLKSVPDPSDPINILYRNKIQSLKAEQLQIIQSKEKLETSLEEIRIATEIERKRRIKRAAYDNEQDRYLKDRAALKQIVQFTPLSEEPLKSEDFDFGEEQNDNIQIVKDVKNAESGYYVVIAVHSDIEKRNDFLRKVVASGRKNVDFFYDVNSSKYFIYYQKFSSIEEAKSAVDVPGNAPYDIKKSIIKIEN